MILSTRQIYLMRLGRPRVPANFGGDSDSDSSTTTTNQTDNYASSIDKRSVASDAAVSLTGNGNTVDRSTSSWTQDNTNNSSTLNDNSNRSSTSITEMFDKSVRDNSTHFSDSSVKDYSTSMTDLSNRSTSFSDSSVKDSSTHFSDSSVRDSSTYFSDSSVKTSTSLDSHNTSMVDNSDRSVSYSTTDYGSVGKALDSLGMMSSKALDVAAGGVNGSIDALKYLADQNTKAVSAAFDLAKSSGANSSSNSAAVLGFASSALEKTAAAFAEAKDGGESKNVMYALLAVAAVGIAFALKG